VGRIYVGDEALLAPDLCRRDEALLAPYGFPCLYLDAKKKVLPPQC
jgi:hypothetical protein